MWLVLQGVPRYLIDEGRLGRWAKGPIRIFFILKTLIYNQSCGSIVPPLARTSKSGAHTDFDPPRATMLTRLFSPSTITLIPTLSQTGNQMGFQLHVLFACWAQSDQPCRGCSKAMTFTEYRTDPRNRPVPERYS